MMSNVDDAIANMPAPQQRVLTAAKFVRQHNVMPSLCLFCRAMQAWFCQARAAALHARSATPLSDIGQMLYRCSCLYNSVWLL